MVQTRSQRRRTIDSESVHSVQSSKSGVSSKSKIRDRCESRSSPATTTDIEAHLRVVDHHQKRQGHKIMKSNRQSSDTDAFVIDQTMTYLCSGSQESTHFEEDSPPDCTCFFLNFRNRIDLQNLGDAELSRSRAQQSPRAAQTVGYSTRKKVGIVVLGVIILASGCYLFGEEVTNTEIDENIGTTEQISENKKYWSGLMDAFWHILFL